MDFSSWARPACIAQVGGFRPPQDPLASWFGRVRVALPGEGWPITDDAPMLALAQFNLRELPCRLPPALADVALLTLFVGPWQLPVDEPNGVNWALRAYPSLDDLVPLEEPTPTRAGDPKLRKGQDLTLRPYPIRWQERPDLPCRDDLPAELLDGWDAWAKDHGATERTLDGTKIGGWPSCLQSQVQWRTGGRLAGDCQYVLQLGSEHKAGLSWGVPGAGICRSAAWRGRLAPHLAIALITEPLAATTESVLRRERLCLDDLWVLAAAAESIRCAGDLLGSSEEFAVDSRTGQVRSGPRFLDTWPGD